MSFPSLSYLLPAVVLLAAAPAAAQTPDGGAPPPDAGAKLQISELTVAGTKEKQTAGSAHILKSEELERLDHDDAHQVVKQVPGVYVRGEDGFGLRPNIGIRGVSPDRSKKVTLMEDGVLFGPAPYSAPAAYYFPIMTRMESVRVIKGPGAVSFGPQTVGGAVDLVTRRVPNRLSGGLDLGGGQYRYGKAHGHVGASNRHLGFLLEGVHLRTDGFKDLDSGGDTGFARNELMGKLRWVPRPGAAVHNELELKLGYSSEQSDESYLGLTDADFRATPLRRYGASQLDHMSWDRTQVALRHIVDFGVGQNVQTTLYRHDLDRTWNKVNGFVGLDIIDVFNHPESGRNQLAMQALQLQDSPEQILIGPNHRDFISQGVASAANLRFGSLQGLEQRIELGARLHYDRIERLHTQSAYRVEGGQLVEMTLSDSVTADNHESTYALALHAVDALTWRRLTLTPGLRLELMRMRARDRNAGTPAVIDREAVLIPGLGAYYALTPVWGVLAGVYRGFSPPAPGTGTTADPEKSWNYEAGVRAAGGRGRAEAIAFFNDYQNLINLCTIGSGCPPSLEGQAFNAGAARIWGIELYGQSALRPRPGFSFPVTLAYTFTRTRFGSTFFAEPPELRQVYEGDRLPYVPVHQGALTLAMETARVGLLAGASYTSELWEQAWGSSARAAGSPLKADPSLVLEAGGRLYLWSSAAWAAHAYVHLRNATNAHDIAAHRPFGARPISPRWLQLGLKASF